MNKEKTLKLEQLTQGSQSLTSEDTIQQPVVSPPAPATPLHTPARKRRSRRRRIVLTTLLLLLVLLGSGLAYGYYYFNTNIQAPLSQIIHPVSRGQNEPPLANNATPNTGNITGRSWNILLLASD